MKSKRLSPFAFVVLLAVAITAVNVLAGRFLSWARWDLTSDKVYTLSPGTREILSTLHTPVQARLYAGASSGAMPPPLRQHARRVEELLREMAQQSRGKLEVQVLNPRPDSDAEDSARLDGIEQQMLPNGESLTLGVSFTALDKKAAVPFLPPQRERLLEYDLVRALAQTQTEQLPVVGLMSPLTVMGNPMAQMFGGGGEPAWLLAEELRREFTLREVPMNSTEIPQDIQTLLVIHPKGITPETEFALDQFVLRGGKLIVFLDPYCLLDGGLSPGPFSMGTSSNLPTLLPHWGVSYDDTQAVADLAFQGATPEGQAPWLLELNRLAFNQDDAVLAGLESMLMAFAGSFSVQPTDGVSVETLISSSPQAQLQPAQMLRSSLAQAMKQFVPSEKPLPLAIRLTGKFKTAFPNGRPNSPPPSEENQEQQPDYLKESQADTSIVLVADADMLHDPLCVTEVRGLVPGRRLFIPINGNLAFAQGSVEQMAGSSALLNVRSRSAGRRPFLVIGEMQAKAEQKFRATIAELEASLAETQNRLSELERGKQEGQRFVLTAEQQREIENFRAKELEVKARLKATRRQLRSEIEALQTQLKWLNIAMVPLLVAIGGAAWGIWRKKHTSAL